MNERETTMISARRGLFRFVSGEDITVVAEIRLPFRFVIFVVLAACTSMNCWEVSISLLKRLGAEFSFEDETGCNDQYIIGKKWDGTLIKPTETARTCFFDDDNALWCSPFEPEEEEDEADTLAQSQTNWRCIDEIDWKAEAVKASRPDAELDQGHPQHNAPDVLDQVREVMQYLEDDKDLPF